MDKVGVVILNYVNYQDTIECIESVLQQKSVEFEIVVVDNASPNEACRILKKKYSGNSIVHILKARKNYGFARGNNIGIRYAREKLQAEFVLVINSDTVLIDEEYIAILLSHNKKSTGVIGSRIILRNGKVQPPVLTHVKFPATLIRYLGIINFYKGGIISQDYMEKLQNRRKKTHILHGCALLFTPQYFTAYEGFYDKTFLYSEEELLYVMCERAGLMQVYVEDTSIYHKEDRSSKELFKNSSIVKMKYMMQSYKYVVYESFKDFIREKVL